MESLLFHPTAENVSAHTHYLEVIFYVHTVQVLASSAGPSAKVWDIERAVLLFGELNVLINICVETCCIGWCLILLACRLYYHWP